MKTPRRLEVSSVKSKKVPIEITLENLVKTLESIMATEGRILSLVNTIVSDTKELNEKVIEIGVATRAVVGKVDEIRQELSIVKQDIDILKKTMEEVYSKVLSEIQKIVERIEALERRVEISGESLKNTMKEYGVVLREHTEAHISNLAFHILRELLSRRLIPAIYSVIHVEGYPLIMVEDHEHVELYYLVEDYSEKYSKLLEELVRKIEEFTDKRATYKLLTLKTDITDPHKEAKPIWIIPLKSQET